MQIKNAITLVTGANRGIGKALVEELLSAGAAKVYAGMRDPAALAVEPTDARVVPVRLDVTKPDEVAAAAKQASDTTLLFNNAGVLDFGDILETPLEAFTRDFDTNFFGKLAMARAFAPVIEGNGGGAIVNLLTVVALASMPGLAVYNASKAAAWSMTQSLRATLAGRGVAVHGVFPGAIDTDMTAAVEMDKTSPEHVAEQVVAGIIAGDEDIFPDPMSTQLYAAWRDDHKAVEKQFATMM